MTKAQLEVWVQRIVNSVQEGQPVEDSAVELKSQWPLPADAARRIAGHANAARGENILWLIGVDEVGRRLTGATKEELANWWPSVQSHFEDTPVELLMDLNVLIDDTTVVALLLDRSRAPYVVKTGDGRVQNELPWRTATGIRTAKRADLLRILVPVVDAPVIEILEGSLIAVPMEQGRLWNWDLKIAFYLAFRGRERIVIPFHRCEGSFHLGERKVDGLGLRLFGNKDSAYISDSQEQLVADGPGVVNLRGTRGTDPLHASYETDAEVRLTLSPLFHDEPIVITPRLRHNAGLRWDLAAS